MPPVKEQKINIEFDNVEQLNAMLHLLYNQTILPFGVTMPLYEKILQAKANLEQP